MKNLLFIFVFLSIFFISFFETAFTKNSWFNYNKVNSERLKVLNIWVEYLNTDGIWYQITHYEDGTIGVVTVARPPDD